MTLILPVDFEADAANRQPFTPETWMTLIRWFRDQIERIEAAQTADDAADAARQTAINTLTSRVDAIMAGANGSVDTFLEAYNRFVTDESAAAALTATVAGKAPLASPAFTGTPTAPTPASNDSSTALATTAWVVGKITAMTSGVASLNGATGALTITTLGGYGITDAYTKAQVDTALASRDAAITAALAEANAPTWAEVTGKPSTFAPSAHAHPTSEITGLDTALAGKAASSHAHAVSDVTGLQTAIDGKQAALGYTPVNKAGDTVSGAIKVGAGNGSVSLSPGGPTYSGYVEWTRSTDGLRIGWIGYYNNEVRFVPERGEFTYNGNSFWHSGNMGAGSGMNADLLDGYHAASFVQDVRLGAVSNVGGSWASGTCSAGYVMTGYVTDGYGAVNYGLQRPVQKQVSGTWITVSQV